MAAIPQSRGFARLGKRFVRQIRGGAATRDPTHSPLLSLRRGVHAYVYDKNVDDQVRPTVVPDEVIRPESEKYWAPHPKTGVFGPQSSDQSQGTAFATTAAANESGASSVLEERERAFFRPLEDLEKPAPYP